MHSLTMLSVILIKGLWTDSRHVRLLSYERHANSCARNKVLMSTVVLRSFNNIWCFHYASKNVLTSTTDFRVLFQVFLYKPENLVLLSIHYSIYRP